MWLYSLVLGVLSIGFIQACGRIELTGLAGRIHINITESGPLDCQWVIYKHNHSQMLQFTLETLTFASGTSAFGTVGPTNSSASTVALVTSSASTVALVTSPAGTTNTPPTHGAPTTTTGGPPTQPTAPSIVQSDSSSTIAAVSSTIQTNSTQKRPKSSLTPSARSTSAPLLNTTPTPAKIKRRRSTDNSYGGLLLHEGPAEKNHILFRIQGNVTRHQKPIYSTYASAFLVHINSTADLLELEFSYISYNITVPDSDPAKCAIVADFLCDAKCISRNLTCDKIKHCDDGKDEGGVCDYRILAPLGHVTVSAGLVIGVILGLILLLAMTAYVAVIVYRRYSLRQHDDLDTIRMTAECDEETSSVPDSLLGSRGNSYGTAKCCNGKGPAVFEVSGLNVYI